MSAMNNDCVTLNVVDRGVMVCVVRAHSLICRGGLSSASGGNSEVDSGSGGLLAQVLY